MAERILLFLNDYAVPEEAHPSDDSTTLGQLTITDGAVLSSSGINMNDDNISGLNNITFTDVNGAIAGVENQNLVDKSAVEQIDGIWTFEQIDFKAVDDTIAGIENQNLLDKTAVETITGAWQYNANITFSAGTIEIAGIQNQNLVDKTSAESISGVWAFTALPTSSVVPTTGSQFVNKDYADAIAAGFGPKRSVRLATTAFLTAVYNNGTAGVGATLTNSGTQAALSLDSVATVVNNRILVKDQIAKHLGTQDMTAGFDWATTNQQFTIAKDAESATTVTLNTATTDVATTVTEINAELTTAGIAADFEAYSSGNFVGIKSKDPQVDKITIAAGSPSALTTLGWTAAGYENLENGLYKVTNIGSASVNWVLTRTTDFDNSPDGEIRPGDFVPIEEGSTYSGYQFYQFSFDTGDAVGTNGIVFSPFSNPTGLTAGDGIDILGNVVSVDVTDIIDTDYGLTESSNDIRINLESDGAIVFDAANKGLEVNVDDDTIGITSNALYVKPNSIGAAEIDETDNYTWTGKHDFAGGDLVFPNNADTSPSEGSVYWDDTTNTLRVYDADASEWKVLGEKGTIVMTAGEALNERDFVYVSAADTIMKAIATSVNCVKTIGCTDEGIANTASGDIKFTGVKSGFTGLTAGSVYYLSITTAGGYQSTIPTAVGNFIIRLGIATSTTDMLIGIKFLGRRRAA